MAMRRRGATGLMASAGLQNHEQRGGEGGAGPWTNYELGTNLKPKFTVH